MMIRVTCPCRKTFAVPRESAGQTVRCPQCGSGLVIPSPDAQVGDERRLPDAQLDPDQCPGCGQPLPADSILCIECGYNRLLGKKMRTQTSESRPSPYGQSSLADEEKPRVKWGMDSGAALSGLAMMGGAVVWFVLGLAFGRIFIYPPVLFCIGLFTFLKGIIGEAGIW